MGNAMARRFPEAGYDLILRNRNRKKTESLAADTRSDIADSPAAAASEADIVVANLADDAALTEVCLSDDGIGDGLVRWLETGTPMPPPRHSYRFARDWAYLRTPCRPKLDPAAHG